MSQKPNSTNRIRSYRKGHSPRGSFRDLACAIAQITRALLVSCIAWFGLAAEATAAPLISDFIDKVELQDIVPEADALGNLRADLPVYEARKGNNVVGYVFLTSDFVTTTGYSGKPIHVVMGVDPDGKITGVRLIKHSEPIVLVGIPESSIRAVIEKYTGLDLVAEAESSGSAHDLDIVSGATVTIMVIDDSIVRAACCAATGPRRPAGGQGFRRPGEADHSVRD
ncbi:FMN-binding protein [Tepidamorphus sp. 3E244]|uniref:FMN-binding protein n=1 Tax=Tepidamorphus sp. 3E244 TaxID=3385498 RepID=UPI0038FC96D1